jgi:hypothetical protein
LIHDGPFFFGIGIVIMYCNVETLVDGKRRENKRKGIKKREDPTKTRV